MSQAAEIKRSLTIWRGGAHFEHHAGEVSYATDANLESAPEFRPAGPSPMESLLGALAGCSGVDLVSILRKMRITIRDLRIEVAAERAEDHPRVYTRIHLEYHIDTDPIDPARVRRALALSAEKYCSVSAMLAAGALITYTLHYGGQRYEGAFHETHGGTHEPMAVPITDELDLHAFSARDVPELVAEFLREAQAAGLTEVRIVHGKGIGVQREAVARVLAVHPAVASYAPAPAHRGHWGATIVILRRA